MLLTGLTRSWRQIMSCTNVRGGGKHHFSTAVVNSYILFKEHQAKNPDDEALYRLGDNSLSSFQEEIV